MNTGSVRKLRTLYALILSAGVSATGASVASAQTTPPSAPDDNVQQMDKFVVTGSNIPTTLTAAEAGIAPVVTLNRSEIDKTGYQNAAELLQRLTVSNQGAIAIANNNTGFTPAATGVSLHGIGPEATLVLINGHRVASYPIGQSGDTAFVDLNTIPIGMIERVDVLKDGASAVYGADAVAGVVNVILRKNYEGSEAFVSYQNTTKKDSSQFTANLLNGVSNDKGNIVVGFNYQSRASIATSDRAFSAVPAFLSTNSSPINVQISAAAYDEALGLPSGTLPSGVTKSVFYATPGITPGAPGGNTLSPTGLPVSGSTNNGTTPANQYIYTGSRASKYNFNQSQWSFPSWTRYGMLLNGERKIFNTDNIKTYFDGSYQVSTTENQLAPVATGDFNTPGQIEVVIPARTASPLPTTDGRTRAAPVGAYNPFNPFNEDISGSSRFRLAEFGNRILRDTSESFLATAGLRGQNILDKFNFDAGIRYSEIAARSNDKFVSASKFNQIMNANDPIFNPASPSYIGTTTPYDPFGYYQNPIANNAKLVAFATVHAHDVDISSIGNGFFTVNTDKLFEVPAGDVGAAAGLDYRIETLDQSPDTENATGDVIGNSKAAVTRHSRKVGAAFAELQVPITSPKQNIPGAYDIEVDVAGRYEKFYTNNDHAAVPKIGIKYQPIDDSLTFRASASKGFLQPSLYKLYSGGIAGLLGLTDPRTGAELPEVPTINVGNPKLKSETSKSYNVGVVWSPKFSVLKGFTTNIDFWRVERTGTALIDNQNTLDRNFSPLGNLPGESVILDGAGNVVQVISAYHNAGRTVAEGVDLGLSYVLPTESIGRFDFSASLSYLHSFKQASAPDQPEEELVDQSTDGEGQDAYLRKKARTAATWTFKGYQLGIFGNFIDGFHDFDLAGNDRRVASTWTWDVQLSYAVHDEFGPYLKDSKITVGAINVFDRDPPLSQFAGANPFNYPGFIYSAEGRMLYVSLDKKF